MIFGQNVNGVVAMEAEHGEDFPGDAHYWQEVAEVGTGNGSMLVPTGTTWDRTLSGSRSYTFNVTTAGNYELLLRVKTKKADTKLWVEIDGNKTLVGPPGGEGRLYYANSAPNWMWHNAFGNAIITLSAGQHTIVLRTLREGLYIDRLAVKPVSDNSLTHGSTVVGPAEVTTGTPPITGTPYTYAHWLLDTTKDANRILLVELQHASGTVYLASRPWLSDENNAYDDWLTGVPALEYSLGTAPDIGDVDAKNPELSEDWSNLHWRGYECKLLFGDVNWKRRDFRLIGRATIQACRVISHRKYRFDLIGASQRFDKTYYSGSEITRNESARSALQWITSQDVNVEPVFMNVQDIQARPVTFKVDESSNMLQQMRDAAAALHAYPRISPTGDLDIIRPDTTGTPVWTITEDDVDRDSVKEVEVTPAVKRIAVTYGIDGDSRVTASTVALTGILDEEHEIATVLRDSSDAQNYANDLAVTRAVQKRLWELRVFNAAHFLQVGDYVTVDHPSLSGSGIVYRMRSTPLTSAGIIEVLI